MSANPHSNTKYGGTCYGCRRHARAGSGTLMGSPARLYCRPCTNLVYSAREAGQKRVIVPREYQRVAATWLNEQGHRSRILVDDLGLGKTVEICLALPDDAAVLVVCPKSAKGIWVEHLASMRPDITPSTYEPLRDGFAWPRESELRMIHYDVLARVLKHGVPACPRPVHLVYDEAHRLQTPGAAVTQAAAELAAAVRRARGWNWLASATILRDRPEGVWSALNVAGLHAYTWETYSAFCADWDGSEGAWGKTKWGENVKPHVPDVLRRVMFGRRKEDVLGELPARTWQDVHVGIDQATQRACDEATRLLAQHGVDLERATLEALKNVVDMPEFEAISRARYMLAQAKTPHALDLVRDREMMSPNPTLVWSCHKTPVKAVGERPGWIALTGDSSDKKVADGVKLIQARERRGLAATIGKLGEAHTLTASDHSIFIDQHWNPTANDQAAGRNHRYGQTLPVSYQVLVGDHALDRRVTELVREKREVQNKTIEQLRRMCV